MNLIVSNMPEMVIDKANVVNGSSNSFIEANTEKVSLEHLKNKCTIPVYAKDNESTISHFQFINEIKSIITELIPECQPMEPDIRVSHVVKGRIPSAIGKPAKLLLENEKTIYYERCAFVMELPQFKQVINGNELSLSVGGVRALNQENLYSKKSLEKFKVFIGYKNKVCTNLCISTDGFTNEIRIGSILDLKEKVRELITCYAKENHINQLKKLANYSLSEKQFAHWLGKSRMFQHLNKLEAQDIFPLPLTDSQINNVVKDYYHCNNFSKSNDGTINLWNFYNLLTESNKSSYIDSNLERNVNCFEYVNYLAKSIENKQGNWYLNN